VTGTTRPGSVIGWTGNTQAVTACLGGSFFVDTSDVLFQLPAFVGNIASASAGVISEATGTVTLPPTARSVTVQLKHAE
jgi:hypothetical protein